MSNLNSISETSGDNSPKNEKKRRNRLSKDKQAELIANAIKLLERGYSLQAAAVKLSAPLEKITSLLIKKNLIGKLGQQEPCIYCIEELSKILTKENFSCFIEITQKDGGIFVKKYIETDLKGGQDHE